MCCCNGISSSSLPAPADRPPVCPPTHRYPEAIQSEAHHTLAFVPKDIARALMKNQQLIAPAVGAFYERDPLQLKVTLPFSALDELQALVIADSTPRVNVLTRRPVNKCGASLQLRHN